MTTKVVNCRTDKYDIYIGRPSIFGNRFIIGKDGTREEVIQKFREWVSDKPHLIKLAKATMKDKILGCYCKPLPCHGDVWCEIVNQEDNNGNT